MQWKRHESSGLKTASYSHRTTPELVLVQIQVVEDDSKDHDRLVNEKHQRQ